MDNGNIEAPCALDKLFKRNVPHILETIFLSLDYESFKKCLCVSVNMRKALTSASFQTKGKSVFQEEILMDEKKLGEASGKGL